MQTRGWVDRGLRVQTWLADSGRGTHAPGQPLPADLLHLSVGCEHVEDLWADLSAALETPAAAVSAESAVRSSVPVGSHP